MRDRIIIKGGFVPTIINNKKNINRAFEEVEKLGRFNIDNFIKKSEVLYDNRGDK